MITLKQIQIGLTLLSIVAVVGGLGYVVNKWHYKPLKEQSKTIQTLKTDLVEQTRLLGVCETKVHKVNIDGFIEGIGENNETIVIDFDNLSY